VPKRVDPPFDAKSIMQHGDQFHATMRLIGAQGDPEFANFATPFVACAAFALEVYLKVLTNIERKLPPLKTHNLLHLFQDISAETQAYLDFQWTDEALPKLQQHQNHPNLPKDYPKVHTFRQALEMSADAFVDWRYSSTSKNRMFCVPDLVPMARAVILAKRPDLGSRRAVMKPLRP